MKDSRIYGDKVSIDDEKVKTFFAQRLTEQDPVKAVMLDNGFTKSTERELLEKELITPLLRITPSSKVLDIGCGLGRWFSAFMHSKQYVGIDFVGEFVDRAIVLYADQLNAVFKQMSATAMDENALKAYGPFSHVIINGLLMYINDQDCRKVVQSVLHLSGIPSTVYVRESVSVVEQRLTLKDHYSNELHSDYNAIYRTPEEYEELLKTTLGLANYRITQSDFLLKGDLVFRKETNQRYFVLERD